jgi:hypothetical protein
LQLDENTETGGLPRSQVGDNENSNGHDANRFPGAPWPRRRLSMAQYSNPHKQRQPEGHELHKSELSDADFTRRFRELYDDTYLDVPSFAELVGYPSVTVASWLGELICSGWDVLSLLESCIRPFKAELPSPAERARIVTRLAERVAEIRQLLERIRESLNWLRDRRFAYEWIWKYFDCEGLCVQFSPTSWELCQQRNTALNALERLRCKVKPEHRKHRFSLQSLHEINARLLGYINKNEDLPGFDPSKLEAICKSKGWSLAELARQSAACVDKASSITFYPEDSIDPFPYDDVFKVPPITAEYLAKVRYDTRKAINPEIWRVILRCTQEGAVQVIAETGTRFGSEQSNAGCSDDFLPGPGTPAGDSQTGTTEATGCPRNHPGVSRDKITQGLVQFISRITAQNIQSLAPETTQAFTQAINILCSYHQKRKANPDARIAKQTILQLYETGFLQDHYLDIDGLQSELARLLGCAESTVSAALRTIKDRIRARQEEYYAERGRLVEFPQRDDD